MMTSRAEKKPTIVEDRRPVPSRVIWISLGANIPGTWGPPESSLLRAISEIKKLQLHLAACSVLYRTPPIGGVRQPHYLNMVIGVRGSIAPFALLRAMKRLEANAGRRKRGYWGPRPLDLDILDHGGRTIGIPAGRRIGGRLILPHPEMHKRGFVLVPLMAVAPAWHHPRLGVRAKQLLAQAPGLARGIRRLPAGCSNSNEPVSFSFPR
jgi:2-amino-4-hydroxy-6-hydroxymethyldihydropteridine diphosphokinase